MKPSFLQSGVAYQPMQLIGFDCMIRNNAIYLTAHIDLLDGNRALIRYCLN